MVDKRDDELPIEESPSEGGRIQVTNKLDGTPETINGPVIEGTGLGLKISDQALGGRVAKAGDVMTGALSIEMAAFPSFTLKDTAQADNLRVLIQIAADGSLECYMTDTSQTPIFLKVSVLGSVDMTGAPEVQVPVAISAAGAARKDELDAAVVTADGAVQKTGDTMSGDLFVPVSANPLVAGQVALSHQLTAEKVAIAGDTMTGPLIVQAAAAATEAAQVSAIDATTGQLQIGGVEVGDTGWRTVASWTAGVQDVADQIGTIDLAAFTLLGSGVIQMRRIGLTVNVAMPNANANAMQAVGTGAKTIFTAGVIPVGFRASTNTRYFHIVNGSAGETPVSMDSAATITNWRLTIGSAGGLWGTTNGNYLTDETWPASLPGIPA